MSNIGIILGILIVTIVSGPILWLVGKLGIGIKIDGFRSAFTAALVIAVLTGLLHFIWTSVFNYTPPAGVASAVSSLLSTAAVLMTAGGLVKGLEVKGFGAALAGALAIAAITYLINFLLVAIKVI